MKFVFKINAQLKKLAQHAVENHRFQRCVYTGGEWGRPEKRPTKPALMIVKDSGVYIMSPFTAKDAPKSARLYEPPTIHDPNKLVVCYAEDHGPDGDWIGGDDFGEDLEGVPEMILRAPIGKRLIVGLTKTTIKAEIL